MHILNTEYDDANSDINRRVLDHLILYHYHMHKLM